MSDLSWLTTVQLPIHVRHQNSAKGTFRFRPSKKVDVIGSFDLGTYLQHHGNIDIAVEMPKVISPFLTECVIFATFI